MVKKTITYADYDGNELTEDFYFNLNKAETIKWLTTSGGYTLDKMLERLYTERNGSEIIKIFEDLILNAYGKKSLDGKRFIKSEEMRKEFKETEAYSSLFMEIISDGKAAADFITSILPQDLIEQIQAEMAKNPEGVPEEMKDVISMPTSRVEVISSNGQ